MLSGSNSRTTAHVLEATGAAGFSPYVPVRERKSEGHDSKELVQTQGVFRVSECTLVIVHQVLLHVSKRHCRFWFMMNGQLMLKASPRW
jgi:hypothetical protein